MKVSRKRRYSDKELKELIASLPWQWHLRNWYLLQIHYARWWLANVILTTAISEANEPTSPIHVRHPVYRWAVRSYLKLKWPTN